MCLALFDISFGIPIQNNGIFDVENTKLAVDITVLFIERQPSAK